MSDWISDVGSSDLDPCPACGGADMRLTPREKDKLMLASAAMVARRLLERGVRLNYPEAVALISDHVLEGARDGRSVADLMEAGAHVLSRAPVMPGIAEMIPDVQVEARSEEHTSELQSLMRISYAVFCLKKKKTTYQPAIMHEPQVATGPTA